MKAIMKSAVDRVYELVCLREENPSEYEFRIAHGLLYTASWDEPEEFLRTTFGHMLDDGAGRNRHSN
jgi:hypothetical protein